MRAKFISEKFSEEGDPIKDMGIGTLIIKLNKPFMKSMTMSELEELYDRVHNKDKANVMVDDAPYNSLPSYVKTRVNNMAVDVMKYKRNIEQRDEVRGQNFKPGDAIKAEIRGVWWFGYPEFSKRGIIKTDSHGRIVAKTLRGNMKVPLRYAVKLTPKEQKEFDKKYFEASKEKLKRTMDMYKEWSPSRYNIAKEEYDELVKRFKNKK